MKLSIIFLLIIQFGCSTSPTKETVSEVGYKTQWEQDFDTHTKELPRDVVNLLKRVDSCNHFGGEEPYNEDRRQEILKKLKEHQCNSVEEDQSEILSKYEGRGDIVRKIRNFLSWKFKNI